MPRFVFHTQTDSRMSDDEGTECIDPEEARQEAIRTCGQMMQDGAEGFWGSRPWSVTVTDAAGLIFWEITMDGFVAPAPRSAASQANKSAGGRRKSEPRTAGWRNPS